MLVCQYNWQINTAACALLFQGQVTTAVLLVPPLVHTQLPNPPVHKNACPNEDTVLVWFGYNHTPDGPQPHALPTTLWFIHFVLICLFVIIIYFGRMQYSYLIYCVKLWGTQAPTDGIQYTQYVKLVCPCDMFVL